MNMDMYMTMEERLQKNHLVLMRHPETRLYTGIFMLGVSEVIDDESVTACTDGRDKRYGREFCTPLNDPELRFIILHENFHVGLMHIPRHKDMMRDNMRLANVAMDIVVNNMIAALKDKSLAKILDSAIVEPAYEGWSVREIYNQLLKENPPDSVPPTRGVMVNGTMRDDSGGDTHEASGAGEDDNGLEDAVNRAIREGGMLAARFGGEMPLQFTDVLIKPANWEQELREIVNTSTTGKEDHTWRRFNRAMLANDILAPSYDKETVSELLFACDTSGSNISESDLSIVAKELASACEACRPDKVRVLWWDTQVHGDQVFTDNYDNIANLLKPVGGGGTRVSCVSEYIAKHNIRPDCVIVLTDGYVERDMKWDVDTETLWLVRGNTSFKPPKGRLVNVDKF
jgi:predicted metal-dependent peptidase